MTAYDLCAYTWTDGWGPLDDPHRCHLRDDHDGKCRCKCDAETWRAAA
jgi:hypothetical protein